MPVWVREAMMDDIDILIARLTAEFEEALNVSFQKSSEAIDINQLASAIAAQNETQIAALLDLDEGLQQGIDDALTSGLMYAIIGGIALAMKGFAARHSSRVNPNGEVEQLTAEIRRNVVEPLARRAYESAMLTIDRMQRLGFDAHEIARSAVAALPLAPDQAKSIVYMRKAIREALQALSGTPDDALPTHTAKAILSRVQAQLNAAQRSTLRKAFSEPLDQSSAEIIMRRHTRALISYRQSVIARQEATRAVHVGEYLAFRQGKANRSIPRDARRFWQTRKDERVRHSHHLVPAMNAEGVDVGEPFQTPLGPVLYPPLEINCRCRVEVRRPVAGE